MAAVKDIKRKIKAVKKTQQITRAMNMVAAAKLRGAQTRNENFRPYAAKFAELMGNLAERTSPDIHPLLIQPETVKKVEVIAFSSDRGLCGSFNMNAINSAERFAKARMESGLEVTMTLVGRKLRDYFRRRKYTVRQAHINVMSAFDYSVATQIARQAMDIFISGEVQEVWLSYTRFVSMARQAVTLTKLLPISPPAEKTDTSAGASTEYLCEPNVAGVMINLLPKNVNIQIYKAMLETSTSEHAARMAAMDNATKNCKEMIQRLTLAMNKARQTAVTAELLDIVGGAEALKA